MWHCTQAWLGSEPVCGETSARSLLPFGRGFAVACSSMMLGAAAKLVVSM